MSKPLVSVIIPTFCSGKFLWKCLQSIRRQTYASTEVFVVDNYSSDNTMEVASRFGARVILFRGARSEARNVGARVSSGEYLLFVDSDMELTCRVIGDCVAKLENGFDAVIISEISVGQGFWAKCRALEKSCYLGDDSIEAARFFKRSVFKTIDGYDVSLEAGEDWDLTCRARKAGYKIGRTNSFVVHNEGKLGLRETVLKKSYYGKTLMYYRSKHPEEARQQLKMMRPAFVRHWRRMAHDPIHATGLLLMKTCEYIAYRISYAAATTRIVSTRSYGQNLRTQVVSRLRRIRG
jgi:glycosyltransferase involved in cell wall biosynthesis